MHIAPIGDDLRWHTIQMAVELVRRERIDVIHAHLWKAHVLAAVVGASPRRRCSPPCTACT